MELTKHAHACVTLDEGGRHLLIDPGELVANTDTVLITHEHFDHFDEAVIAKALDARPELRVYGPGAVVDRWSARAGQVVAVAEGDRFTAAGFDVAVHGDLHARIHQDIPLVANVGYLVEGRVYHPGDAYHVPSAPVRTLLLPTSGPWTQVAQAVDYVRAVGPEQLLQIHEVMLSDLGQQAMARFLGPDMLSSVPLAVVPVGETVEV
jgi:L-ascorbate metabolism protein UlaG (beta-lactamase superfamily)